MNDSFSTRDSLTVNGIDYTIFSLALGQRFDLTQLPFSMKILLENLRCEDGVSVTKASIEAVAQWKATDEPATEIAFMPARVVLQVSLACPASSILRRCATRWSSWVARRPTSTR